MGRRGVAVRRAVDESMTAEAWLARNGHAPFVPLASMPEGTVSVHMVAEDVLSSHVGSDARVGWVDVRRSVDVRVRRSVRMVDGVSMVVRSVDAQMADDVTVSSDGLSMVQAMAHRREVKVSKQRDSLRGLRGDGPKVKRWNEAVANPLDVDALIRLERHVFPMRADDVQRVDGVFGRVAPECGPFASGAVFHAAQVAGELRGLPRLEMTRRRDGSAVPVETLRGFKNPGSRPRKVSLDAVKLETRGSSGQTSRRRWNGASASARMAYTRRVGLPEGTPFTSVVRAFKRVAPDAVTLGAAVLVLESSHVVDASAVAVASGKRI